MTFCEGKPLNEIEKHSYAYEKAIILTNCCYIHMSYKYKMSHCDFHPGNILVQPNGDISLIDFGLVVRVVKKEDSMGLFLLLKIQQNINLENITSMIRLIGTDKNIYNQPIDIKEISVDIYQTLINLPDVISDSGRWKFHKNVDNKKSLNILIRLCRNAKVMFRGDCLLTIVQLANLDALLKKDIGKLSQFTPRSLYHMKYDSFFVNELGYFVKQFYEQSLDNTTEEEISRFVYYD